MDSIQDLIKSIKREYLRDRGKNLATERQIREHCRSFFEGQIFLSHTSKDHDFCKECIVPVLAQFGLWSYFFMGIGGADALIVNAYRFMVEYSLFYCKTIIFAISEASVRSDWVRLEARWAIEQRHPRIICLLDGTPPGELHTALEPSAEEPSLQPPQRVIHFYEDIAKAQSTLDGLLHSPAFAHARKSKT